MATGSLALLAVLAGIAGFALYKHLKSQKKAHSSARTIGNRQHAFTAKAGTTHAAPSRAVMLSSQNCHTMAI